jgi:ABC-type branched-subunit amino acid transport system substrate-binding protein
MRKLISSVLPVLILVIMLAVGCAKPAPSVAPAPAPTKTLDIGVNTSLTGAVAFLGTHLQNAILLAIDDQNNQGGVTITGQKYTLNPIIRDSKFDVVVSKNVSEELVYDKGVKIIAGPMVGDAVGAQVVTEKKDRKSVV